MTWQGLVPAQWQSQQGVPTPLRRRPPWPPISIRYTRLRLRYTRLLVKYARRTIAQRKLLYRIYLTFIQHIFKVLVANYGEGGGGGYKTGWGHGGHVKFYQSFGVVFTWKIEVLATLKGGGGGTKCFHSLKGGCIKFYPVLRGRHKKVSDPMFDPHISKTL